MNSISFSKLSISNPSKIILSDLCERIQVLDLIKTENRTLYFYKDDLHFWQAISHPDEIKTLRTLFRTEDQPYLQDDIIRKIANWLRNNPDNSIDFSSCDRNHLVNLKNGVFDVSTGKLYEHRKEYYFRNVLDANFIEPSSIPNNELKHFNSFCSEVFDSNLRDQKIKLLLQIIGYTVSNIYDAKKAAFIVGPANSGKSVILRFIHRVLGEDAVSTVALENLADRFSKAELHGKIANISGEIPIEMLAGKTLDIFKSLVGGDKITAERKGKDPFIFRFEGSMLFAGNVMPSFKDTDGSEALLSRIVLLIFNNGIAPEKQDRRMEDKLFSERDQIISRSLDSLSELVANDYRLAMGDEEVNALKEYKESSDSVGAFINEALEFDPDGKVYISDAYEAYEKYVECMALSKVKLHVFRRRMLSDPRIKLGGKCRINKQAPKSSFAGISIIKSTEESSENPISDYISIDEEIQEEDLF